MTSIFIDEHLCIMDGACVKECPFDLIQFQGENGYPGMIPGGERGCIACGHCIAVCSHGALRHTLLNMDDCPIIDDAFAVNKEQARQFLRARRSIRRFQKRTVEKEKIEELIGIAAFAPNAGNLQLLEWQVFTDRNSIKSLASLAIDWIRHELAKGPAASGPSFLPLVLAGWEAGKDTILWDAPVLIFVSAPRKTRFGLVDLSLALSYLELYAPALGLGTCWAGLLQHAMLSWPPAREHLGITEDRPHYYAMMLGYPDSRYYRMPIRKPARISWRSLP